VTPKPPVVLKFGGTSVATAAGWRTIAAVVAARRRAGLRPVVVCSALAGVTNTLQALATGGIEAAPDGPAAIAEQHRALLAAFDIRADAAVEQLLARVAEPVPGRQDPAAAAELLSCGELLSTRVGAQLLAALDCPIEWRDVRELLVAAPVAFADRNRQYLNAECRAVPQAGRGADWLRAAPAVLTQGFLARNETGETVLLGRGGSDTSAALLGVLLGARRVEIWTDVPGMFSADPNIVGGARLLRHISYREAAEIAATGGRVLHPRSIEPLRRHHIPLQVRSTQRPELPGTRVSDQARDFGAQAKAVLVQAPVTVISMRTPGMWQQVGFLAEAFAVLREFGLSVDALSSSQSTVTVTVDARAQSLDDQRLQALQDALAPICKTRVYPDCAAVSLVGRGVRTVMHRLAPALETLEERRLLLTTQADDDVSLVFAVPAADAELLARQLHSLLVPPDPRTPEESVFGPSWGELQGVDTVPRPLPRAWWRERRAALLDLAAEQESAYVYHLPTVARQAERLRALASVDRVLYAIKANPHPVVLDTIRGCGLGFDCGSLPEIEHLQATFPDLGAHEILYSPNFESRAETARALAGGVTMTVDSLHALRAWPELFAGRDLFLRVDPGQAHALHPRIKTVGSHSKFGLPAPQMEAAASLCAELGARVVGLHIHLGTGLALPENWRRNAELLVRYLASFPDADVLDLGGGLAVPTKSGDAEFDLERMDQVLAAVRAAVPRPVQLWLEPGRFLVSAAGVLLTRVTQIKAKDGVNYVGAATGMNSLIRPALYGAYHEIVNLTRLDHPAQGLANVVGPICETADILGMDRMLAPCREDDVLLVANAGAYGAVMASRYNLREPAAERVLER